MVELLRQLLRAIGALAHQAAAEHVEIVRRLDDIAVVALLLPVLAPTVPLPVAIRNFLGLDALYDCLVDVLLLSVDALAEPLIYWDAPLNPRLRILQLDLLLLAVDVAAISHVDDQFDVIVDPALAVSLSLDVEFLLRLWGRRLLGVADALRLLAFGAVELVELVRLEGGEEQLAVGTQFVLYLVVAVLGALRNFDLAVLGDLQASAVGDDGLLGWVLGLLVDLVLVLFEFLVQRNSHLVH